MNKLIKQQNLQLAKDIAFKKLKDSDIPTIPSRAGGTYCEEDAGTEVILIDYLGKPVRVAVSAGTIECVPDDWTELGGPVKSTEEIFILHYLIRATGKAFAGNLIPFRNMDGGIAYDSVFRARSVNRLVDTFRNGEEHLTDTGVFFGGTPGEMGSASVRLKVLPYVELELVLWKGDDELPSSGNIFFAESIIDYLPTEDCVVMTEAVVSRFVHVFNKNLSK